MTWTLRTHGASKLGAWLFFVSWLVACASVLGIEDRSTDTAGNYPSDGYDGCRPGDCSRCLGVHQKECEARSACAEAADKGDCAACVCDNCIDPLLDCQQDEGCTAIWQCLRDTRCDLSERAERNCAQTCGTVIQENGGINGSSFRAAAAIRTCATTSACLTCLAPQVTQSTPTCTQQNGCQDCPDCFNQCLCSGEKFGNCQMFCDEAPSSACSDADQCAGCSNCFDACACGGGAYDHCLSTCSSTTPDTPPDLPEGCSPDDGCAGCDGCAAQCQCAGGGDASECTQLCAPPSTTDACIEDSSGGSSLCDGCQSCVAKCTCRGAPIENCWGQCQVHDCSENQIAYGCGCAASTQACYEETHGACDTLAPCEACACQKCPGEQGTCESPGCRQTFDCMRSTHCQGGECLERCRGSDLPPEDFAYAEALWACYQGAQCGKSCEGNAQPSTVDCPTAQGTIQCAGFIGINASVAACCPPPVVLPLPGSSGAGTTSADDNPCGLTLSRYIPNARSCEPREQSKPPRYALLETCPDRLVANPPYNGAKLKGCCRGADDTCGYFDDITGLGCLSAGAFGDQVQSCP